MKNLAIARRYAKALILIGQEDGQAEQYNEELAVMVGLFDTQEGFESALVNPLISKSNRKQLFEAVVGAADLSDIMKSFLTLLFDKGFFDLVNRFIGQFRSRRHTGFNHAFELICHILVIGSDFP